MNKQIICGIIHLWYHLKLMNSTRFDQEQEVYFLSALLCVVMGMNSHLFESRFM